MKVLDNFILSKSAFTTEIDVPIEKIDIGDWLFTLPEAEYQRCCPPDHVSCGTTVSDDGQRMMINVEMIGTGLVVQHYVAEEVTATYCRMNSISDVFTGAGRTQVNVIWELTAEGLEDGRTRYTNSVTAHPTDAFMDFIAAHGITYEDAAAARQEAGGDHNRRETPLFAASIARRALAK
ncbi:hypothetical protein PX699_28240 [Sphingobium sp. H39-3-25]|uniref:hypothetical protein n=1 Tax=Sphingobium arseniciresistens TaxID=3030834 RepID=UPI0023B96AB2|nr:hypothetical protein [Sphingobium arseniciresistens]